MSAKHNGSTPRAKSREARRARHHHWMETEFRALLVAARLSGNWTNVTQKAVDAYQAKPLSMQINSKAWIKSVLS